MNPFPQHFRPQTGRALALALLGVLSLLPCPAAHADGEPALAGAAAGRSPAVRNVRSARPASGRTPAATAVAPAPAAALPTGLDAPMVLDLRHASVSTALRVISEVSGLNLVATQAAAERELTLYMARTTAGQALDALSRVTGLWVRWREASRSYLVMSAEEYQREMTLFGEERTEVLRLRHHNVQAAAHALRALFGSRVRLQSPAEEALGETLKTTDLRRAVASGGQGSGSAAPGNRGGAQAGAGAGAGAGASEAQAQAAGVVREQRGGMRGGAAGNDGAQTAAAAAAAGAQGAQVEAAISGQEAPLFVTFNRLHNLLVLRSGDARALAEARALVQRIDLPARQVMLEMRIIQVRLGDEFHRAFDMDFFSTSAAAGVASTATGQTLNPLTGATTPYSSTGALVAPKSVGALGVAELYDKNSGLFQFLSNRVRLRLQLLEEQGRVQTLARPMLLASNNEPARLFIGEEVVLTTGASAQTTTGTTGATNTVITAETERRNIGTTLVIHPRINDDRTVTLTIDQENSERVVGGTTIPLATGNLGNSVLQYPIDTVNTATVQAVALAKDGLTIAVGGMIKLSRSSTESNVPGLSALPVFGELFKRQEKTTERSELVLVITPHVLETPEEGQRLARQIGGVDTLPSSLGLQPAGASDLRRDAQRLADLALQGLVQEQPAWLADPSVQALPAASKLGELGWPLAALRSRCLGAWSWQGLTAVALEVRDADATALAALQAANLPGAWTAVAIDPTPQPAGAGAAGYLRRVVLVSERAWADISRGLQP